MRKVLPFVSGVIGLLICLSGALAQDRDGYLAEEPLRPARPVQRQLPNDLGRPSTVPDRSAPPLRAPDAVPPLRPYHDYQRYPLPQPQPEKEGWRPMYLLSGPSALFKGLGASLWCVGNMSANLYSDVETVGQGFTATILWTPAVLADSILSASAYTLIGLAHTVTFGFLVSEPPKQIEDIRAPIYCIISDHNKQ